MNPICNTCNIEIFENLVDRTVCKNCFDKIEEKTKTNNQKSTMTMITTLMFQHMKITPTLFLVEKNVGKIYYMLKMLEKIGNQRPIHITTRSPNQYSIYKTSNEIKPRKKYKGSVVIFDDMLGARNRSRIDDFSRKENMKI